jgi:hypothetical protein
MTVKELKEKLNQYPDNMSVFLAERKTEFSYGLLNSVRSKQIDFKEDPDDKKAMATDTVIVLDEE